LLVESFNWSGLSVWLSG